MKFYAQLLIMAVGLPLFANAGAIERKQPGDVDVAALTKETQRTSNEGGMRLVWWIPWEYWEASLSRDPNVTESARKKFLDKLNGYSVLVVLQADMGRLGDFAFYERDVISKGLQIEISNGNAWSPVAPMAEVPDDMASLLKVLGPLLSSAMGAMGENLNFFVLDDHKENGRLISPFDPGAMRITLADKKGVVLEPALIEFPLDSLYVPRWCPNGKPAHVSWVVCPWDGSRLPR